MVYLGASQGVALSAPFACGALVLGVAGIAKLAQQKTALAALAEIGIRRTGRPVLLGLAGLEVGASIGVLVTPSAVPAFLAAALYATFAAFVALLLFQGKTNISCGCFGQAAVPLHWTHVGVNLAFAAVCVLAAWTSTAPMLTVVNEWSISSVTLALGAVAAAYLTYAVLTLVPSLEVARPGGADTSSTSFQPPQAFAMTYHDPDRKATG